MRIHYLQHVPFEDPDWILTWAGAQNFEVTYTRLYKSSQLIDPDNFDFLVVMGGPMSVGDTKEYPWMVQEKQLIQNAIQSGKHVLGICLGAQLIAEVLGSRIYPNPHKEIGWWPVQWTDVMRRIPIGRHLDTFSTVFQWHGDTFDLPKGAIRLAENEVCQNQAFLYQDRVMGFQFHLESMKESIAKLIDNCRHELVNAPYIQTESEMLEQSTVYTRQTHNEFELILNQWMNL